MVQVKIVKDGVKGADDGATVRPYAKGVVYRVSDALAEVFIEAGEAVEVEEEKTTVTARVNAKAAAKEDEPVKEPEPTVAPEPTAPAAPTPEPTAPAAPIGLPGLPSKANSK
ncbi:hypothetical protein [Ensifer aridi]|uniref:hypothetical protein n=1 Tax=Ensifer aridi TaxID=1708715 RepID=UPI000A116659|nr:hypothetical protein [Ensifer aridi]